MTTDTTVPLPEPDHLAMSDQEACDRHYRGNSVRFIYDKKDAYRLGIDRAFDALRECGIRPDGRTKLCDLIRQLGAQCAAQARRKALEDCARLCEAREQEPEDDEAPLVWSRAAEAIRALARQEPRCP